MGAEKRQPQPQDVFDAREAKLREKYHLPDSTRILDGNRLAAKLGEELSVRVARLQEMGITPGLVALRGNDLASQSYVAKKEAHAKKIGINSHTLLLHDMMPEEVMKQIGQLNADPSVHGILVQLPLVRHLQKAEQSIRNALNPLKDVDCMSPGNR